MSAKFNKSNEPLSSSPLIQPKVLWGLCWSYTTHSCLACCQSRLLHPFQQDCCLDGWWELIHPKCKCLWGNSWLSWRVGFFSSFFLSSRTRTCPRNRKNEIRLWYCPRRQISISPRCICKDLRRWQRLL